MNRNYGKLNEGKIAYAPETLYIDGKLVLAPRAEHFAAAGWLKIYDDKPVEKAGVCFIPYGWEAREGAIYRTYREEPLVPPAPPVIRYSKLKLIVASKAAGKWDAFKAFIEKAGYEDEWNAAQFLSSGYAQFEQAKTAIIAAEIATSEEIEAILAASVDEEVE